MSIEASRRSAVDDANCFVAPTDMGSLHDDGRFAANFPMADKPPVQPGFRAADVECTSIQAAM
ncbi:hypothetical protein [Hyphomicrobium sp. 2TAF46]|uniref:hypothetical protein n=1 Tax=Hyphomicrobium sp. 2TAF46 TaxID=3233019 RepID=UPI003F93D174